MDMRVYWQSLNAEEKRLFADKLDKSRNYLAQIACGAKSASHSLAKSIEIVTEGLVTRYDLRPDIYDEPPIKEPEAA